MTKIEQQPIYVSPKMKTVEIKTRAIICQSGLTGSQNEEYGIGNTDDWFNN